MSVPHTRGVYIRIGAGVPPDLPKVQMLVCSQATNSRSININFNQYNSMDYYSLAPCLWFYFVLLVKEIFKTRGFCTVHVKLTLSHICTHWFLPFFAYVLFLNQKFHWRLVKTRFFIVLVFLFVIHMLLVLDCTVQLGSLLLQNRPQLTMVANTTDFFDDTKKEGLPLKVYF